MRFDATRFLRSRRDRRPTILIQSLGERTVTHLDRVRRLSIHTRVV
jgi:hypothetical protein